MQNEPYRIAVIEDSPVYLTAIEYAIADTSQAVLVGTAETAEEGIHLIERTGPDLVMVDLFLKRGTGIEVLQHYRSQKRETVIAVMTNSPSPELERHCRALGAAGFHDKAQGFDWIAGMANGTGSMPSSSS